MTCCAITKFLILSTTLFSEEVNSFQIRSKIRTKSLGILSQRLSTNEISPVESVTRPKFDPYLFWDLNRVAFSLLPLAPGPRRKTILKEVVPGTIWTMDQIQGVVNVNVPVRATIIKLKDGGLFVHNPVAPTKECLSMIKSISAKYGPVKHIVLASLGLEHKALAGPFSQYFPKADVWIQPGQWSFPINLPNALLGFPLGSRLKEIPSNSSETPWFADIDHLSLGPLFFKSVGGFGETAFFHRSTKTLLVTDAVVSIGDEPPDILTEDPRAILFHARDEMLDVVEDTRETRRKGWRRLVIFGLFFFPSGISVSNIIDTFRQLPSVTPEMASLGRGSIPINGGLYPWKWIKSETANFKALQGGLLVAPILRKLILNREPTRVLEWADKVSKWPFQRIITSHIGNDIKSNGKEFRAAFSFLETNPSGPQPDNADLALLDSLSDIFTRLGVVAEPQPLIESKKENI
eukprot:gene7445-15226_t